MCVVRKYVVKRPEIEERERERLLLFFWVFRTTTKRIFSCSDGKRTHTKKKKGKHPSPDKNKGFKQYYAAARISLN
jgi:hypothetical protein